MGCDYTIHVGEIPVDASQRLAMVHVFMGIKVAAIDHGIASKQPSFRVGETSFLKAQLTGDRATFIASPIEKLLEVIPEYQSGETKIIDDEMIVKAKEAIQAQNTTGYEMSQSLAKLPDFLTEHRGKPCYSICW